MRSSGKGRVRSLVCADRYPRAPANFLHHFYLKPNRLSALDSRENGVEHRRKTGRESWLEDHLTVNIIGQALSSGGIVLGLKATDAKHLCAEIAALVARRHPVDEELVFRALWRREQCGSTAIGHGIAVPHARIPGIVAPVLLFARTKEPIPFGALDHQRVSAFFAILVPEHANEEHLRILATVSEMFSEKAFRKELDAATEPGAIQRLFGNWASEK